MYTSTLSLVVLAAITAKAADTIQISICDDAKLPPVVLRQAQRQFDYVMGRCGIGVHWTACLAVHDPVVPRLTIRIRFSPKPASSDGFPKLGRSFRVTGRQEYAEVFADAIRDYAQQTAVGDPANVLACAMLHEAGHLLGIEHTRRGIMAARINETELAAIAQRRLWFTKPESLAIVAELRNRVMLDSIARRALVGDEPEIPLPSLSAFAHRPRIR